MTSYYIRTLLANFWSRTQQCVPAIRTDLSDQSSLFKGIRNNLNQIHDDALIGRLFDKKPEATIELVSKKDNGRFMIIDDDSGITDFLSNYIEFLGFRKPIVFNDPFEAIKNTHFLTEVSSILCDYNIPGLNGIQVLEKLKKNWQPAHFFMLTGDVNERINTWFNKAEGDGFLVKPFNEDMFKVMIDRVCGNCVSILNRVSITYSSDEISKAIGDWAAAKECGDMWNDITGNNAI